MNKILVIESSPGGANSWSRKATVSLREKLAAKYPGAKFTVRDLAKDPVPHVTGDTVAAMFTPPDSQTPDQKKILALSNTLVEELMNHDALVVSIPFWNFGAPSVVKAWLDHIVRSGMTFKYTDKGPVGLVGAKPVYVVVASGGFYTEPPMSAVDHGAKHLMDIFGFLGMSPAAVIRVEGTAMGEASAKQGFEKALKQIATL